MRLARKETEIRPLDRMPLVLLDGDAGGPSHPTGTVTSVGERPLPPAGWEPDMDKDTAIAALRGAVDVCEQAKAALEHAQDVLAYTIGDLLIAAAGASVGRVSQHP